MAPEQGAYYYYQKIVEQERAKAEVRKTAIKLRRKNPIGIAGVIDVETTGLNPSRDEVIELAIVLFSFERSTGRIIERVEEYSSLREPSIPIGEDASRVNCISMSDVKGHRIDYKRIEELLDQCEFLVAHNAEFDRAFVENSIFVQVAGKKWYCSMRGINWRKQGSSSMSLQHLLKRYYIETGKAHRAIDDCRATLKLLSRCDKRNKPFLAKLLKNGPYEKDSKTHRQREISNSCLGCLVSFGAIIIMFLFLRRCY
jgi:DNA polymerase-3 subunit epsilon